MPDTRAGQAAPFTRREVCGRAQRAHPQGRKVLAGRRSRGVAGSGRSGTMERPEGEKAQPTNTAAPTHAFRVGAPACLVRPVESGVTGVSGADVEAAQLIDLGPHHCGKKTHEQPSSSAQVTFVGRGNQREVAGLLRVAPSRAVWGSRFATGPCVTPEQRSRLHRLAIINLITHPLDSRGLIGSQLAV